MAHEISASILSADMARLGEDIDKVLAAGADMIHVDIMDNHFVPNLTMGPLICSAIREYGITAPLDVHLMIEPVDTMIPAFIKAGASYITFHMNATPDTEKTIELIKSLGCKTGIAINPDEPIDQLIPLLPKLDLVLMMTVNPGFAGQSFIPDVLDKVKKVRQAINAQNLTTKLSIDGGINATTITSAAKAGCDIFVAGSAIFKSNNYEETIHTLKQQIDQAH